MAQDDGRCVVKNVHVLGGLNFRDVKWAATTLHDGNWFPLTWISLMADASLYGSEAGGFHLTNVLLHVLNVVLVFSFFAAATGAAGRSALCRRPVCRPSAARRIGGVYLGTQRRAESFLRPLGDARLPVLFAEWTALLVSGGDRSFSPEPARQANAGDAPVRAAPARFLAAGEADPAMRAEHVGEDSVFSSCRGLLNRGLQAQSAGGAIMSLRHLPFSQRLLNAVVAYGLYLQKIVFPVNLAFFYPHPRMLGLADVALPFLLLFGISATALTTLRRLPFLFVGWCWFLGTLVPLIGLVQIGRQQMADRYMYFPAIGLYVAGVWTLHALLARFARPFPLVAAAVVGVFAVLGSIQVGTWRNNDALFLHALKVAPDNPVTRGLYGQALIEEGRVAEGLDQCQRAVELAPDDSLAHYRLRSPLGGRSHAGKSARADGDSWSG